MNSTIKNIAENTRDINVRDYALALANNAGRHFKAVFIKKNGERREMVFTPSVNWNALHGIRTTFVDAVVTKCRNDMATVIEKLPGGGFQPRTLNLRTIISLEMI